MPHSTFFLNYVYFSEKHVSRSCIQRTTKCFYMKGLYAIMSCDLVFVSIGIHDLTF